MPQEKTSLLIEVDLVRLRRPLVSDLAPGAYQIPTTPIVDMT